VNFKKIRYDTGENIVIIKIKDGTGKFIENWTINMSDLMKFVRLMKRKYGIEFGNDRKGLEWAI